MLLILVSSAAGILAQISALSCTGSSTILYTTDCTKGFPTSYCTYRPTSTHCSSGYYPGQSYVARCIEETVCYPVPTYTPICSNGFTSETLPLYSADSTMVYTIQCDCSGSRSYAGNQLPGTTYCLPTTECPGNALTVLSTQVFCLTQTASQYSCDALRTQCVCPTSLVPDFDNNRFIGCTVEQPMSITTTTSEGLVPLSAKNGLKAKVLHYRGNPLGPLCTANCTNTVSNMPTVVVISVEHVQATIVSAWLPSMSSIPIVTGDVAIAPSYLRPGLPVPFGGGDTTSPLSSQSSSSLTALSRTSSSTSNLCSITPLVSFQSILLSFTSITMMFVL